MNYYGQSIVTGGGSEKPIDQILVERYGLDKYHGTAIECGANDGLYLSTCLCLEEIGWDIINIEASLPNYLSLIANRKKSLNIFASLHNIDYTIIQIDNLDGDNGGGNKLSSISTEFSKRFKKSGSNNVPTFKYKTLITQPIDLFVLDVEGNELNVLEGLVDAEYKPDILCVEHVHCGINNISGVLGGDYKLDFNDDLNAVYIKI